MHPLLRPLTKFEATTNGFRWLDEEGVNRLKSVLTDIPLARALLGDWRQARAVSIEGLQVYYCGGTNYPSGAIDDKHWKWYQNEREAHREYTGYLAEFPKSKDPQSPPEDVLTALSIYDEVLAEMSEASQRPRSAFVRETPHVGTMVFAHHHALVRVSHAYRLRAVANIHPEGSRKDWQIFSMHTA